ncbi:MAG: hypothetical protein ABJ360_16090 [Roseobacter sp.]
MKIWRYLDGPIEGVKGLAHAKKGVEDLRLKTPEGVAGLEEFG